MQTLGQAMLNINVAAVNNRYFESDHVPTESGHVFQYTFKHQANIWQVLKSLDCFLYQCSEGNVPEKSRLYAALTRVADTIRRAIIDTDERYDKAQWA